MEEIAEQIVDLADDTGAIAHEPAAGHENFQRYRTDPATRDDYDPVTARSCLQTVNSDEEQLEPETYCSRCGSNACFRKPETCRSEDRLVLTELIHTGWIGISTFNSF